MEPASLSRLVAEGSVVDTSINKMLEPETMKIYAIHLTLLLCSIFASIASQAEQRKVLEIGWVGPLSGNSAVLGIDSARAVSMVFEAANADPTSKIEFKLLSQDDLYNTQKSVTAYQKLANIDNVPEIIYLTYGGLFAVSARAQHDSVLMIDPLDCNESVAKLETNTICIAAMTEGIGALNAKMAMKDRHELSR